MATAAGTRSLPGGGKSVFPFGFFSRSTQEHAEAREHACSRVPVPHTRRVFPCSRAHACALPQLVLLRAPACSCVLLRGSHLPTAWTYV